MRIIVWGINYAPELTGIGPYNTALCEFLAQRGHEVEMVAGFEYYPAWKKRAEDRSVSFRTERRRGVLLRRCWLYVPREVRALKRIAHEASFVLSSLARVFTLAKPDIFVVVSPPLFLGLAAIVAKFLKRAPFVFHVQDLQPDAALRLGMLRAHASVVRLLYAVESLTYFFAARVSSISPGIMQMLRQKGVPEEKLVYFPNGVRFPASLPARGAFRVRHGFTADTFLVVYAGNLGLKQGLDAFVDAAVLLQQRAGAELAGGREIRLVIAGAGAGRAKLVERVEREGLRNVLILPLQPEAAYHEMLVDADCCAITQLARTGSLFFPSKLLSSLAFRKAVISLADEESDLAIAVREGGFGTTILPGNAARVVEELVAWAARPEEMVRLGEAGRRFAEQFEMSRVLGLFESELRKVIGGGENLVKIPARASEPV